MTSKAFIPLVLSALVVAAAFFAFHAQASRFGDADCSGTISSVDALFILQHDAGLIDISPTCAAKADTNHDGAINAIDAALVLQHVAGLIALPTPFGTGNDVPTPARLRDS